MTKIATNRRILIAIAVTVVVCGCITVLSVPGANRVLAATCDPNSLQTVSYGQTSAAVTDAQACLIQVGYSIPAGATGYYGNQTVSAVTQFYATWFGYWDGMSIGPQGIQHLQSAVLSSQPTQQQPTSSSTVPVTTTQTTCTAPGSSTLTKQAGQPFTINWCAVNVVSCEVAGSGLSSTNCLAGSSPQQFSSSPITINTPGTYYYTIIATGPAGQQTSACSNSTLSGLTTVGNVTVTITAAPPTNQNQNNNGNASQPINVGASGCSLANPIPCFNLWTLTAITPQLPSCKLTASPSSIIPPQGFTLSWSCDSSTQSCIDPLSHNGVGPSGSDAVASGSQYYPTKTTTYTLDCSNPNGSSSTSTTVTLTNPYIKEVNP